MTSAFSPETSTIFDVLARAAERYGDRESLVIGRREEVASFRDLAISADRFARLLAKQGVRPGDRVALWMTNSVKWAVSAYAIARCGAVMVAVSTRLTPREVAHMLRLSRARAIVMEDRFLGKVDATEIVAATFDLLRDEGFDLPKVVMLSRSGAGFVDAVDWDEGFEAAAGYEALPPAGELVAESAHADVAEIGGVAAILSTSGTTSAPKGVMLTHQGLLTLAREVGRRQQLDPTQKFYSVAPFFHCSGYMHGLLTNLMAGSTYFSTSRYDLEEFYDVVVGEGINAYHGFVGALRDLARKPDLDKGSLKSFDRAWYSAPADLMKSLEEKVGTRMCEVYGLTETGGNVAICRADDPEEMRFDSDGRPHEGVEVRIVGPDGPSPDGEPGEILVRGWNVMRGYFGDPEATRKAIDADGFLHTGDIGVRLPDGFIKFLSRDKDVIRVGGENLSPMEVEEVLLRHGAIAEAAVVSMPDERLGEVPVAFLILDGGKTVAAEELDRFARGHLANFKVPRRFIFVDDFPRTTATNRIQKARLRASLTEPADA